jgi:hypothetical protein
MHALSRYPKTRQERETPCTHLDLGWWRAGANLNPRRPIIGEKSY